MEVIESRDNIHSVLSADAEGKIRNLYSRSGC